MIGDDSLGLLAAPREPTAADWRGAATAAVEARVPRGERRSGRRGGCSGEGNE